MPISSLGTPTAGTKNIIKASTTVTGQSAGAIALRSGLTGAGDKAADSTNVSR